MDNKCVPLVYILSGDKKGDTYEFVLNVIKHYFDQHCPVDTGTILIDFEKAVMNAFSNSLPGWEVSNCFFHLCQAVQKNIQKIWNHFARIIRDPEFPRTSNMVEGFHRGFKSRVHRPKPSVQEYVRAIKEQQVITDFHIDRLSVGKTPAKRRRTCHTQLHDICSFYSTYSSKIEYLFTVASMFGHDI